MQKFRSISVELAIAQELAEKYGGTIIRRKDGFVFMFRRVCEPDASSCKKVIVWFRKSPINEHTVTFLRRTLKRIAHDEVWLVKLYVEPDFTDTYKELVSREFTKNEFEQYLEEHKEA